MESSDLNRKELAMTETAMTPAEQFFYDHAGYGYRPTEETEEEGRVRCAQELASAEAWAQDLGLSVEWESDPDGWDFDDEADYVPSEVLGAVLCYGKRRLPFSLWGIADPSREFGRVIEAELYLEARTARIVFPQVA